MHFVGPDFALIGIGNVFDALHDFGFERVPFLEDSSTLSESAPAELDKPCKSPD